MDKNTLPITQQGFIRLPDILRVFPVSKSTWWAGVKHGKFPQPVKLGPNITAWRADDIHTLLASYSHDQE